MILRSRTAVLTPPLKQGQKSPLQPRGSFLHDDILGKAPRDTITAHRAGEFRLAHPTLEEYVTLTPRKVTPIYAHDANLIVSLLDIHVGTPSDNDAETAPLEILESGTGHGSLTLHLARAIHAANPHPPRLPPAEEETEALEDAELKSKWTTWRENRRAILHTVEISPVYSNHAQKIVRGFRRGMYAGNIDFHISDLDSWISSQIAKRQGGTSAATDPSLETSNHLSAPPPAQITPFLSIAILDLPDVQSKIQPLTPLLHKEGLLLIFVPSITQIGECVTAIADAKLPFVMERTVELGQGMSSGRLWDVRLTRRRAGRKKVGMTGNSVRAAVREGEILESGSEKGSGSVVERDGDRSEENGEAGSEAESVEAPVEEVVDDGDDKPVLVCRPKVGERIVNGGFVAVFRKIYDN